MSESVETRFEPVILAFTCNWCSYRAADLAGTARIKYPPNVRLVRLMCSGRLDPAFVLKAFESGAVCQLTFHKLNALREQVAPAMAQVVKNDGLMPMIRQ